MIFGKKKEEDLQEKQKKTVFFKRKNFKYGSTSTIFTIIFIAAVILLNVVLTAVNDKVTLGVDLTNTKTYNLSTATTKYLKTIKTNTTIYILADKKVLMASTYYAKTLKIIEKFEQTNSNITIKYINLDNNPTFASQYSGESLAIGDVIVTGGSRYKHIASSDLFEQSTDTSGNTTISGYKAESAIDSALEYVSTSNLPKMLFTKGHNEADSTGFQSLLKSNNYDVTTENISTASISSDISALAIVYPTKDFTAAEINKIDTFLTNNKKYGRNLIVLFDPRQSTLPNLENYVKEWGIQVEKGAIYDTTGYSTFEPLAGTLDTAIITGTSTSVNTDLVDSRPLTLLFSSKDIRTTTSIVSTSSTSKLWNPTSFKNTFKASSSDKKGPFTVIALGTKTGTGATSNVMVSGSTDMVNSTYLNRSDLNNNDVMMDTINHIAGIKSPLTITSKYSNTSTLNLTTPQIQIFAAIFVFIIPLGVLIAGLVIWLRRRHL